jgi:hypothetical protein
MPKEDLAPKALMHVGMANKCVEPTGGSRFARRPIERHRRLPPVADLAVGPEKAHAGMNESKMATPARNWPRRVRTLIGGAFLVFVVYALSLGPAYRLLRKDSLSQRSFSFWYSPILHMAHQSRLSFRVMDWYLTMWYSDEREMIRWFQELKVKNE